eukprot:TRINITY_DN2954_c0_g1_i1.p1 TRINITY_DN2954_c0_g1~~TRINITY_DN2954_c0_g1_i1.p1  ORF type:complete len:765 (+),score=364.37 TRINITY_DN2954_c0_g1_i1:227-2521(+)
MEAWPLQRKLLAIIDEDVDEDPSVDGGIPLTFAINVFIMFVVWVLYHCLRPHYPRFFYPRVWNEGDKKPPIVSFANFSWLVRTVIASKDEVGLRGGMYGLLYIQFQVFMLLYIIFMTVFALSVLIPVNAVGRGADESGWVETTAVNIKANSTLLIAHVVLVVLFQVMAVLIILWYQQLYFRSRKLFRAHEHVNSRTVYIRNLSRSIKNGAELQHFMDILYPGQVVSANLGFHAPRLLELKEQKENAILSLEHEQAVYMRDEQRPMRYPGTCGVPLVLCRCRAKEDSIEYWKRKIPAISGKITRLQKRTPTTTGVAFVTFAEVDVAHTCLKDFYVTSRRRNLLGGVDDHALVSQMRARQWHVDRAPPHTELFWNHFIVGRTSYHLRQLVLTIGVLIVAAVWAVPISLLTNVEFLIAIPAIGPIAEEVVSWHPVVQQLLEGYVPSLLTSLFIVFLPEVLEPFCTWERPHNVAARDASIMRNYYTFVIFNVFIFPMLFIGSLNTFQKVLDDGLNALARINFSIQGAFFANYIIQQAFMSGCFRLIRLHHLIFRQLWIRFLCVSDTEYAEARRWIKPMELRGVRFSQMLIVVAILQTFAVIAPLILICGILYFLFLYIYDKNNILHVYPRDLLTDSSMIPTVINQFIFAQIISNAFLILFFYTKQAYWGLGIVAGLLLLDVVVGVVLYLRNYYEWDQYIRRGSPHLVECEIPEAVLAAAYKHPGLVEEGDDIEGRLERSKNIREEFMTDVERDTRAHQERALQGDVDA